MSPRYRPASQNRTASRQHITAHQQTAQANPSSSHRQPLTAHKHESPPESSSLASSVYVGESAIAGRGVFATRAFTTGDRILRFDDSRHITDDNPLRPELGEVDDHVDHLANGVLVYMYEPERYLNHRCEPNAYCRHFSGVRYLVARQPIAAGEELVVDYSLNSAVPGHTWICECGAANCRGVGHLDFFQLPPQVQRDYFELLDGWFIEEHLDRLNKLAKQWKVPGFHPECVTD